MKEPILNILMPGTPVILSSIPQGPIAAVINKTVICSVDLIIYEVTWWEGGTRRVEGVRPDEISVRSNIEKTKIIGFKKEEEK